MANKKNYNFFAIKINPGIFFTCVLAFIPIFCYYFSIFVTSINIPVMDDYDAILGFANNFLSGAHNKFTLLFSLHNEHRIFFCRALTVMSYFLTGSINFRLLTIIGNFSLFVFAAVLFSSTVFTANKIKPLYFIPVVFILFQPQYWESCLMSMASLSSLPVLLFVFLTLHCLKAGTIKNFFFSLVAAIFATFINGNGMFVFFSGLIILCFQRRYKECIIWFWAGIITVSAYHIGYSTPGHHPSVLLAVIGHPIETMKFFFYFIGASLSYFIPGRFEFSRLLSLSGGVFILLYFIFLSFKIRSNKVNIITFAFLLYLFIIALVVSLCRSGFGVGAAFSSRYMLYSDLFLIFIYLSFIEVSSIKVIRFIFPLVLVLSLIFNFSSYRGNFPSMLYNKKMLRDGLAFWKINGHSGLRYPNQERANAIMREAIKNGLYELPKT